MICLEEQIEAYLEQIMKDLLNTYNLELIDKHIDIYHMLLSLKKNLCFVIWTTNFYFIIMFIKFQSGNLKFHVDIIALLELVVCCYS